MLRPPPRSTLFPTRRSSDLRVVDVARAGGRAGATARADAGPGARELGREGVAHRAARRIARTGVRSEEHTSELQSRLHLVCRLLLEKKNQLETTFTLVIQRC